MTLYTNCILQAPDGKQICLQSMKNAHWYLRKGLAELISEDPFIVRLFKEPNGRGREGDPFYMTPRKNECVVCGATEHLTRHHVIPQFFRRHFPLSLKASANHDVLAACETCHRQYCVYEEEFKKELSCEWNLDFKGRPKGFPKRILKASSILKILLERPDINLSGRINLARRFFELIEDPTPEILDLLADTLREDKQTTLGKEIVNSLDHQGLIEFSKRWRHHFLDTMKPRFLPDFWDPDREEP